MADKSETAVKVDEAADFEAAFNATLADSGHPVEAAPAPETVDEAPQSVDSGAESAEEPVPDEADAGDESEVSSDAPAESSDGAKDESSADGSGLPLSAFDEDTIKALLAKSSKVDELEQLMVKQSQELRRAYGKIGELNSHIKQLMKKPTQQGIKQAELRFARLESEYPELAELLREDLSAVLNTAQESVEEAAVGSGAEGNSEAPAPEGVQEAQPAPQFDPEAVVAEREKQLRMEYEAKLLSTKHPDWQQIAQSPDFQIWLAGQPAQVQQVARTSWSAEELSAVFDLYKSASQALAAKAQMNTTRKKRLETAVPVSDTTSAAPPVADEVDEFLQGFESVMKQRLG